MTLLNKSWICPLLSLPLPHHWNMMKASLSSYLRIQHMLEIWEGDSFFILSSLWVEPVFLHGHRLYLGWPEDTGRCLSIRWEKTCIRVRDNNEEGRSWSLGSEDVWMAQPSWRQLGNRTCDSREKPQEESRESKINHILKKQSTSRLLQSRIIQKGNKVGS